MTERWRCEYCLARLDGEPGDTCPYCLPTPLKGCHECGRVFDLLNVTDAAEWYYGHDCEVPPAPTARLVRTGEALVWDDMLQAYRVVDGR